MAYRPVYALAAIVVSVLPWPALRLLDRTNRGCGDGLCGFLPGLLIVGFVFAGMSYLLTCSRRRSEEPWFVRVVPPVLLLIGLYPLFV